MKNLTIGLRVLIGSGIVLVLSVGLILPLAMAKLSELSNQAEQRELENLFVNLTEQGNRIKILAITTGDYR
ncbi:hypothetical protein [Allochromatium vinosum]|uniref:hypothetical protein n=1 Tax=Allochromatium vinosum TaxID=1049 RepID=UPI001906F93D|nr:hypothetical protein [Allochromatium vinosum]MBK1655790.1 hypothetical protein [Allochromatium vinosum]